MGRRPHIRCSPCRRYTWRHPPQRALSSAKRQVASLSLRSGLLANPLAVIGRALGLVDWNDIGRNSTLFGRHHPVSLPQDAVAEPLVVVLLGVIDALVIETPPAFGSKQGRMGRHVCTVEDRGY